MTQLSPEQLKRNEEAAGRWWLLPCTSLRTLTDALHFYNGDLSAALAQARELYLKETTPEKRKVMKEVEGGVGYIHPAGVFFKFIPTGRVDMPPPGSKGKFVFETEE